MRPVEFYAAVEQTAQRFHMDLSRPLAMVSGGPDSVALLRALVELGSHPVVLHVEHGLRGEDARKDARFVQKLCEELGLAYEERRAKLAERNLQEEARKERYRFAEQLADELGLSSIATGHTADDVAETVILNLARGAGLRGLAGIPPVRGCVVRPLIRHRRSDVLHFLKHLKQTYRTDTSNLTPKYARNRVRLEVLPVLEELHPGAGSNIARGASLLREDFEILEGLVAGVVRRQGEEVIVPLGELERMPPALQRYVVRRAYALLVSDKAFLDSDAVERILELTKRGEGTRTGDLPGGVTVAGRFGEELALYYKAEPFMGERNLLTGEQSFDGWILSVREVRGYDSEDAARPEVAYLDAGLGPYRVRMAREGDTMRPLGLGGTKKVMRTMMDRKVPKDLRRRTPVVVDRWGRVAWVFLGEAGEEFKVDVGTEKVLRLEVERIP